jgi:hypothetical protein
VGEIEEFMESLWFWLFESGEMEGILEERKRQGGDQMVKREGEHQQRGWEK